MGVSDRSCVGSEQSSNRFSHTGTKTTVNVINRHVARSLILIAAAPALHGRHITAYKLIANSLLYGLHRRNCTGAQVVSHSKYFCFLGSIGISAIVAKLRVRTRGRDKVIITN